MPTTIIDPQPDLPAAVRTLALRLGADPAPSFETASFQQTGSMRINLKSRLWLPFRARQTVSVTCCAFAWHARFQPFGYLAVTDALEDGVGRLDVTALGLLALVRTTPTAILTKGELIRYLAELPFVPDAILHNHHLRWREIDGSTLAVSAGRGETACEVVFSLGPDQAILSALSADRSVGLKPPYTLTPWRGVFADYRDVRGRFIPSAASVAWEFADQTQAYWKGRVHDWEIH